MEKCWLIRTKNKQILGPVTKQKIIEFVQKGSLAPEDEVTSGNGYWISIKEDNLIEKYVMGDIPQSFNPISEAPNILTSSTIQTKDYTGSLTPNTMPVSESDPNLKLEEREDIVVPGDDDLDYPDLDELAPEDQAAPRGEDLEYPDMDMVETSPRLVLEPEIKKQQAPIIMKGHVDIQEPCHEEEGKLPEDEDLEYPSMREDNSSLKDEEAAFDPDATDPDFNMSSIESVKSIDEEIIFSEPPLVMEDITPEPHSFKEAVDDSKTIKKKSKQSLNTKKKTVQKKNKKSQRNDRYLFYILVLLIGVIAAGAYYYFTNILNSDVVKISNPFIQSVQAQSQLTEDLKKKAFLKYLH